MREELNEVMNEISRARVPLGRMPMGHWTSVSLWVLRVYVLVILGLIALKFLQTVGVTG